MARRKDIYRGKRRHRFPVVPVVTVLIVLLAIAVILFYGLQKYAVYSKDGVKLASPGLTQLPTPAADDGEPSPSGPRPINNVPADIVVDPADYSAVSLRDGAGVEPMHGRWYTQKQMRAGALASLGAATQAQDTLVLEMVDYDGALFWASPSQTAQAYAVNGQADLGELLAPLRDKGYRLVAAVSCTRQTLLAKRCPAMSLRNAAGMPAALEGRLKERVHDLERKSRADDAAAESEDVRIVVPPCHLRAVAVAAESGADAAHLVHGDGDTDAGAADGDAAFAFAACNGARDRLAVIGVVAAFLRIGAEVLELDTLFPEMGHDFLLQGKAAVVGSDR